MKLFKSNNKTEYQSMDFLGKQIQVHGEYFNYDIYEVKSMKYDQKVRSKNLHLMIHLLTIEFHINYSLWQNFI